MPEITIPVGKSDWLSSNDRHAHWRIRAARTRAIRTKTKLIALNLLAAGTLTKLDRARIIAYISMPTNRRSDPGNAAPTVKAMIDGLVDAHILPDDDRTHVIGPDYREAAKTGVAGLYRITLTLEPLDPETLPA